jgi:hypothetical protein
MIPLQYRTLKMKILENTKQEILLSLIFNVAAVLSAA